MLQTPPMNQISFSGHETFPFRYAWLKKGFDAASADGLAFSKDDAMTVLGVGKNMVRSIRHWCLAAGILEEIPVEKNSRTFKVQPSDLGRAIFSDEGWDPYLEDLGTLWLLHWQISSSFKRATTWFWAFSFFHEPEFSKEALVTSLLRWASASDSKQIAESSIRRDIDCFIRTYVPSRQSSTLVLEDTLDCPFIELNLILETGDRHNYQFNRGLQSELPEGVLFFAILDYWSRMPGTAKTLSLRDLCYQPGSPGRLFQLDEDSLAARLEGLSEWTKGKIVFDDNTGLKQLYRHGEVKPFSILKDHYSFAHSH